MEGHLEGVFSAVGRKDCEAVVSVVGYLSKLGITNMLGTEATL